MKCLACKKVELGDARLGHTLCPSCYKKQEERKRELRGDFRHLQPDHRGLNLFSGQTEQDGRQ